MKHKNDVIFNAKLNGKQKFSLRKLSIGLVAVALGTTFYLTNGQLVHADENTDQSSQTAVVENQSQDSSASTDSNSESSSSDDASIASTTSSTSDEESQSQTGSEQSNSSTQETAKTEDSANSSAESTSSDDDNSDSQTVSTGSIIDGNADASTLKESKSENQQTVIVSSNAIDENGQVTSDPANTTMMAVQSEEASSTEAKELTSDTYQVNNVSASATDKTTDASSHEDLNVNLTIPSTSKVNDGDYLDINWGIPYQDDNGQTQYKSLDPILSNDVDLTYQNKNIGKITQNGSSGYRITFNSNLHDFGTPVNVNLDLQWANATDKAGANSALVYQATSDKDEKVKTSRQLFQMM